MKTIYFTIPGRPVAKQRPRKGTKNFYTPKETRAHETAIAYHSIKYRDSFTGPVSLVATFHTANKRLDGDNALKCLMDGLQKGGVFKNDSQVKDGRFFVVHDDLEMTEVTLEGIG